MPRDRSGSQTKTRTRQSGESRSRSEVYPIGYARSTSRDLPLPKASAHHCSRPRNKSRRSRKFRPRRARGDMTRSAPCAIRYCVRGLRLALVPLADGPDELTGVSCVSRDLCAVMPQSAGSYCWMKKRCRAGQQGAEAVWAISKYRQKAFASFICRGVRHSGSNRRGLATRMHVERAREVATLRRLWL